MSTISRLLPPGIESSSEPLFMTKPIARPLRTKILSFALFLVVFTIIIAVFAFIQRQALTASIHAGTVRAELLKAHDDKSKYVFQRNPKKADDADTHLSSSIALLVHFENEEGTERLRIGIQQYISLFRQLTDKIQERGINENSGAEGAFRRSIHEAQRILEETHENTIEVTILQARRREKDFFMRRDEAYLSEVRQLINLAQLQTENSLTLRPNEKKRLEHQLTVYLQTFEQAATLITSIQVLDAQLDSKMEYIQPLVAEIVAAKQVQAVIIERVVWCVMVASLLSSIILAFWIAHHLSAPISQLQRAVQRIASGNHESTVNIRSRDEVGHLAEAFNIMSANVRHRTLELQASNDELIKANMIIQHQKELLEEQTVIVRRTNLELSSINLEQRRINAELEQANNENNEFLGIAAHDLKNPLAGMRGLVALLQHSTNRLTMKDVEETAQILSRAIEKMFTIIKNLLDINAIETGNMRLRSEPFEISSVVADVVSDYYVRADEKGIRLHYDAPFASHIAQGDNVAMAQVLDNIVSNAVKYSPSGRSIWVRVLEHGAYMRVEVQDEGPGLSQEDKKQLFGKFVRLSAQPTGNEHSTGLGLSIVKRIIEAMNGNVWCESELGIGATFIVEIPAHKPTASPVRDTPSYTNAIV
jgi:signal transduction histidine kinase